MSTQPDGGPAFPMVASSGDSRDGVYCQYGMSLREWYVGKALEGVIAYHGLAKTSGTQSDRAQLILQQVDALLNELEKEKKV